MDTAFHFLRTKKNRYNRKNDSISQSVDNPNHLQALLHRLSNINAGALVTIIEMNKSLKIDYNKIYQFNTLSNYNWTIL